VTADLLDSRFDVRRDGGVLRLAGEARTPDPSRLVLGKTTPFVGRERELAVLLGLVAESAAEEAPRTAVVDGPAGSGKSRLRRELVARLPPGTETWLVRGDSVRQSVPLAPLSTTLASALGLVDEPRPDARRALLVERVSALVSAPAAKRAAAFLGELAGAPFDDADLPELRAARLDPTLWSTQLAWAIGTWLDAELCAGPRVLVLEDVHWLDAASVRLLARVVSDLRGPLVVLGLGRPEAQERFPSLWKGAHARLGLGPISRKASERLVRALVEADGAFVERLVEWGEGSPLLLEELARASSEGGLESGGTVGALIQARLEGWSPEDRRLLRAAAVFGSTFWSGGVAFLCGGDDAGDVRMRLARLAKGEVVLARPTSRLAGEEEHAFRHDLLREAAYALLTDDDRVVGHRLAAEWLQGHGEVRLADLVGHLEQAGEYDRAAAAHLDAARRALVGDDLASAAEHATRGRELARDAETQARLLCVLAETTLWQGGFEQSWQLSGLALARLPKGSPDWLAAVRNRSIAATRYGKVETLAELVAEIEAMGPPDSVAAALTIARLAERTGAFALGNLTGRAEALLDHPSMRRFEDDPTVAGWVAMARGALGLSSGAYDETHAHFAEALACFEQVGNVRGQLESQAQLTWTSRQLGDVPLMRDHAERALELAEQVGARGIVGHLRMCVAWTLHESGRTADAVALLGVALAGSEALDDRRTTALIRNEQAMLLIELGDVDGAAELAARAVDALAAAPERSLPLATLASAALRRGQAERALELTESAMRSLEPLGLADELRVRLPHVLALRACGRPEDADRALDAAVLRIDEALARLRSDGARARMRSGLSAVSALLAMAGR
jgi:tetratricopeptide (TPR) repeat protein